MQSGKVPWWLFLPGGSSFQEKAQSELKRRLDDRVIPERKLEQVVADMVAAAAVPSAFYGWTRTEQGTGGYKVEFLQRAGDVVLVKPSIVYAYSPGEPSRFAVQLSTTVIGEDAYKERLLGTARIGYDPGIRAEYYHPFGAALTLLRPTHSPSANTLSATPELSGSPIHGTGSAAHSMAESAPGTLPN